MPTAPRDGRRVEPVRGSRTAPQAARRRVIRQRIGAAGVLAVGAVGRACPRLRLAGPAAAAVDTRRERAGVGDAARPRRCGAVVMAAKSLAPPTHLSERRVGTLPAPLEDAGAALAGSRVVLAGGLTAQDTSTAAVIVVRGSSARTSDGRLPSSTMRPRPASLDRSTCSAAATASASSIRSCHRRPLGDSRAPVGSLPAASSDAARPAVGPTAYVVGGYTGTRWLDTIVAWRPGCRARVVAHLPPACATPRWPPSGTSLVIAGGTLPDGSASRAVYRFDTRRRTVRRVHRALPAPRRTPPRPRSGGPCSWSAGAVRSDGSSARGDRRDRPEQRPSRPAGRPRPLAATLPRSTVGGRVAAPVGGHGRPAPWTDQRLAAAAAAPGRAVAADVYAADRAGRLTGAARRARALVYVPNSEANTVT